MDWVYLTNGVSAVGLVGLGGGEPVAEGDGEGIQGGLPSHGPPCPSGPGGVKGAGDQVEALEGGLLGREVASGLDCPPVAALRDSMALVEQMTWRISMS
jgi:hypothetical protein